MQANTSYHHLIHLDPPFGGGDSAPSLIVSEASEPESSVDAPTSSTHNPASTHEEDKWELLLLLLSILSLVATVVTLSRLNGNSLESWGGFFLGPNTVISILAAISKTTLAFAVSSCVAQAKWNWYRRGSDNLFIFERIDQASKGPWGRFRLLGAVRIRHWSALGALIIITLLAYEPFLQTIITQYGVPDIDHHTSSQATTGRCLRLDAGQVNFDGEGGGLVYGFPDGHNCIQSDAPRSHPDFGMTAAVYNGFQSIPEKQGFNASIVHNRSTDASLDGVLSAFGIVADSLSNWIRDYQLTSETGRDTNPSHIGRTQRWTIHYGVRWPFLVLPLVLDIADVIYVSFTIWETKKLRVTAWKDSALATLAYGLEGEENRALLKEADVQGKMDHAAREMRVAAVGDSIVHIPDLEPDELLEDSDILRHD
ncbi:hypothetical protein PG987_005384 [Apiospora arundinis]